MEEGRRTPSKRLAHGTWAGGLSNTLAQRVAMGCCGLCGRGDDASPPWPDDPAFVDRETKGVEAAAAALDAYWEARHARRACRAARGLR